VTLYQSRRFATSQSLCHGCCDRRTSRFQHAPSFLSVTTLDMYLLLHGNKSYSFTNNERLRETACVNSQLRRSMLLQVSLETDLVHPDNQQNCIGLSVTDSVTIKHVTAKRQCINTQFNQGSICLLGPRGLSVILSPESTVGRSLKMLLGS